LRGEQNSRRGQLKGYIFEVVVRRLLKINGFQILSEEIENRVKIGNYNNIEIKGRGTWHQIDCPCILSTSIPFIYNLRLLVEAKFYSKEIQKNKIREYITVIKDISENYFIDEINTLENQKRYTDVGVFFAANGFQEEAEKLAFVHGLKTISYKNNFIMDNIKPIISLLEEDYLKASKCITYGKQNYFMELVSFLLDKPNDRNTINKFREEFEPLEGFQEIISKLAEQLKGIRTSFFGVTESNYFLHFISNDNFPSELFYETDTRDCRVFFNRETGHFKLKINGDHTTNRFFYFSAPYPLLEQIFSGQEIIDLKEKYFSNIKVSIILNGISRNIVLKLDLDWLKEIKNTDVLIGSR